MNQSAQAQDLSESIFDAIGHGIIVLDTAGNVVRFNQFMREAYGWTDDDLARDVFEMHPDLEEVGIRERFEQIVERGQPAEFRNLHRITRQGLEVYQNLWGYPLYQDGEIAGAVVMIEDVTEQVRLESDLQEQITRRKVIAQLSHRISSILDLDQLLEETVTLVTEAFDYYNVAILLVDETSGDLVLRAEAPQEDSQITGEYRQAVGEGMIGWVAQSGQPLLSNDVRQEPHYLGYLPDTRSELDVPLQHSGRVLGVLDVQSDKLNAFEEEDVVMLQVLADQIAVAIENAYLYARQEETEEALRRRAEELSVLHRIALAGAEANDPDDLIERITEILATTLYQENIGFLLLESEVGPLRPHPSYHGVASELREIVVPLGTGISGTVAQMEEPLLVPDVRSDPRYLKVSPTVKSELCVPVRVEGEIAGVINVESPELDGFSQEDLHLVSTVAEHVGTALARLRLFEETRRRNEELAARNAIVRAVSRSLDIDDVLDRLYQEVDQLLALEAFFVALYDEDDERFDIALVIEHGERLPRFSAKLDEAGGLTAWIIQECQPLLVRDLLAEIDDLPADPQHVTEPARSWLGVPLVARGQVIGVLSVQSFEINAFDRQDAQFLSAVADQVAMAIDNARLYKETRRMAFTDGLTGLYNSRYFYRILAKELARSDRYQHPVSLLMLDLDDFKKYNDQYGHLAGDDLLRELADLISEVTRETDIAARYGGEEFAIILPETAAGDAMKLGGRVRELVGQHEFEVRNGHRVGRITISVGVASYPNDADDVKSLVHAADMALLDAKTGKDQVCLFCP